MNLNMEIGKSNKYPTKKTLNLAVSEEEQMSSKKIVIAVIAAVIVVGLVVKFGVIDQLAKESSAKSSYESAKAQNDEYKNALLDSVDIQKEYRLYSRDWLTESSDIVSRQEVLDMVESQLMGWGTVKNVNVTGNVCTVDMTGMTLEEISAMFIQLNAYPIVESAQLNSAETGDDQNTDFNITINLKKADEEVTE